MAGRSIGRLCLCQAAADLSLSAAGDPGAVVLAAHSDALNRRREAHDVLGNPSSESKTLKLSIVKVC